jgi:dTDP-4-dehydrorhamnose reductase
MVEKAKILITGVGGMLGWALVNNLSREYEVKGIDIQDGDITDQSAITKIIKDYRPKIIIHAAAYTDVDGSELNRQRSFAVNAKGTESVSLASKEINAVLFYISTDYVFDGQKKKPYIETDLPHPINIYGQSKLAGEKIIQSLLDKYFILRTSWLFGPKGKNFVTTILNKAEEDKVLKIVSDQLGSPTYTLDLAKVINALIANIDFGDSASIYGIYHITNSGSCSWYEFAKKIISLRQLNIQVLPISSQESKRPAQRPKMSVLDNAKLKAVFNLSLRPWQEALNHFLYQ